MKLLLASTSTSTFSNYSSNATRTESLNQTVDLAAKRAVQTERLHSSMMDQSIESSDHSYTWRYLPYTIGGSLVAVLALIAILAYVVVKRRRKANSQSVAVNQKTSRQTIFKDNSPKFSLARPQVQLEPTIVTVPDLNEMTPTAIDSETSEKMEHVCSIDIEKNDDSKVISVPLERTAVVPLRIKAKGGLLERRGSNASLTIDVNPIVVETFHLPTPPKECTVLEYLTSGEKRLTRRQLKACLKDTKALHQEFLDIPLNHPHKIDMPGCSNKNRYKSIWPNEETRVVLPQRNNNNNNRLKNSFSNANCQILDDQKNLNSQKFTFCEINSESERVVPNADIKMNDEEVAASYINANYIRAFDSNTTAYIAAQGPLTNTIDDFWSMIWNERCPCIVMMTRLRENNRVKCEQYLPNVDAQYGDIHVTVRTTVTKNGYSVRDLQLKHENEIRHIKHFWFTGWPDHKAPSSTAKQLIDLVQDVELERHQSSLTGPVLVHCSAGLGRTGCFIATSMGMKQLQQENVVDILGIVCQLRIDRGGMIQTVEQYEFVHYALAQFERHLPETPSSHSSAAPLTPLSSNSLNSRSNSKYEMPF